MDNSRPSLLYLRHSDIDERLPSSIQSRGWNVHIANNSSEAVDLLNAHEPRVGLAHVPQNDEQRFLRQSEPLLNRSDGINWVALLPDRESKSPFVRRLIADYFYDYHTLPADVERLLMTLGHADGMVRIGEGLDPDLDATGLHLGSPDLEIIGQSPVMRALCRQLRKVATAGFNVLIRGESGTGKELIAQAVHKMSARAEAPFVAVNCGALPRDLIQAELFGHEKGSFTGADRRRIGHIEAAQGGTLFLDEIGDLPLDMQVNLLRFLQERTIQRVGGTERIPVDVRIIAATHVNLEEAVARGDFREDLYYRLNVLQLEVPPLREREGDIELLAYHFFRQFSQAIRPQLRGFSVQAVEAMNAHTWPGNVRELLNRVQRAVVMCENRLIRPRDLALDQRAPGCPLMTLAQARANAEKAVIEQTLAAVRNNVSRAARCLDVSRVTLYRLMEQHGVEWQRGR